MSDYTKEIMDILKSAFESVAGERTFQAESDARAYYLQNVNDNLYKPMDANAEKAYGEGSGNEIASGKICALKSSSALTYNLFWDQIAEISGDKENIRLGNGVYKVEFEKQFRTLKSSSVKANLDAFLYCKHTKEAIACEMKMTEWIFNKPGKLRSAYLDENNYLNTEFGKTMVECAKKLIHPEFVYSECDEYPCKMEKYDAFQMFKHVSACYTACKNAEEETIKKLTLVNCAWMLSTTDKLSSASRDRYIREEAQELHEFKAFKEIMSPVKQLFSKIGVDFDICFLTFNDFLSLMKKTPEELNYLRRYTMR